MMTSHSPSWIVRHLRTLGTLLFLFAYGAAVSYATPPTSPYQPGATLDPSCIPGSANCSVQILPDQTGNANRLLTTDGSVTSWTNTLTGISLSGATNTLSNIPNSALTNSSITINGSPVALGGSVSNLALTTSPLSQFAATTSAQLAGVLSDESGTGNLVLSNAPTFTGNITAGTINGQTISDNANFTGDLTVQGTTLIPNSIIIDKDAATIADFDDGGIIFRGDGARSAGIGWMAANTLGSFFGRLGGEDVLVYGTVSPFVERVRFSSAGLQVSGNSLKLQGDAPIVTLDSTGVNQERVLYFRDSFGGAGAKSRIAASGTLYFGANGFSSEQMVLTSTGNLGINDTTPSYKLDVSRSDASGYVLQVHNSFSNRSVLIGTSANVASVQGYQPSPGAVTTLALNPDGGYVGIGTTTPVGRLDVSGIYNDGVQNSINLRNSWPNTYPTSVLNFWAYYNETNPQAVIEAGQDSSSTNAGVILFKTMSGGAAPAERMRITPTGNVGIGISSLTPGYKLDVGGNIRTTGIIAGSTSLALYGDASSVTPVTIDSSGNVVINDLAGSGNRCVYADATGQLNVKNDDCGLASGGDDMGDHTATQNIILGSNWISGDGGNEGIRVDASGNVGVGLGTPARKLSVYDGGTSSVFQVVNGTTGSTAGDGLLIIQDNLNTFIENQETGAMYFRTDALNRMTITSGGLVGIGTTSPNYALGINTASTDSYLQITSNTTGTTASDGLLIGTGSAGDAIILNRENTHIRFENGGGEIVRFTSGGNVGIGTTSPGAKLDVSGSANITGSITTGAANYFNISSGPYNAVFNNSSTSASDYNTVRFTQNVAGTAIGYAGTGGSTTGNVSFRNTFVVGTQNSTDLVLNTTDTERVRVTAAGAVGIATSTPHAPLEVVGRTITSNLVIGPYATLNDTTGVSGTLQFGNGNTSFVTGSADAYIYKSQSAIGSLPVGTLVSQIRSDVTGGAFAFVGGSTPTPLMTILSSGNVGVGTSAPETNFQVRGTAGITSFTGSSRLGISAAGAASTNDYSGIDFDVITASAPRARIAAIFTNSGSYLRFGTSNNYSTGITNTAMTIDYNGKVGVGIAAPTTLFNVSGYEASNWIIANSNTGTSGHNMYFGYNNGTDTTYGLYITGGRGVYNQYDLAVENKFYVMGGGGVGIGTASPGDKLDVRDGRIILTDADVSQPITNFALAAAYGEFEIYSSTGGGLNVSGYSDTDYTGLILNGFMGTGDPTDSTPAVIINGAKNAGGGVAGALNSVETVFQLQNNASAVMTVLGSGNVGIGTTAALSRLHVSGQIIVGDGSYVNQGGDPVAGMYDSFTDGTSAYFHNPGMTVRKDSSGTRLDQAPIALSLFNGDGTNNTWTKLSLGSREETGAGNPVSIAGIASQKTSGTSGAWASGDLILWTKSISSQVEVLRATSGGRVGIGTTSPTAFLNIQSSSGGGSSYRAFDLTSSGQGGSDIGFRNTYGDFAVFATTTEDIGNGTYNDGVIKLKTAEDGTLYDRVTISSRGAFSVTNLISCGGIQTNGSGTMSCTSDETLKDKHGAFTTGLSALRNINPEAFSWKEDSGLYDDGVIYYGFIAQNVQSALPEAISLSANGKLQVSQLTLLAASINAIKELDIKVQSLPDFADQSLAAKVAEFLQGIAERGEALVGRVRTSELCVDDVCVTRDQFLQIVQQSGAAQSSGGGTNDGNDEGAAPLDEPDEVPPVSEETPTEPDPQPESQEQPDNEEPAPAQEPEVSSVEESTPIE